MEIIKKFVNFFKCNDTEFSCNSGSCISLAQRCDEVEDCNDKSDEINCTLATMHELLYRKEYPPINSSGTNIKVFLRVDLDDLGSFEEMSMTFTAKVYLQQGEGGKPMGATKYLFFLPNQTGNKYSRTCRVVILLLILDCFSVILLFVH